MFSFSLFFSHQNIDVASDILTMSNAKSTRSNFTSSIFDIMLPVTKQEQKLKTMIKSGKMSSYEIKLTFFLIVNNRKLMTHSNM